MEKEKTVARFWIRLLVAILTLLGGSLVIFTALISSNIFSSSLPLFASKELGLSSVEIGRLSLIRLVVTIVSAPLFGFWGDRIGRRKLSLIGALVLGASIAITGQMTNFFTLALGYFGVAIGISMLLTSIIAQMLKDTGTHWLLASVAAIYFTLTQFSIIGSAISAKWIQELGIKTVLFIVGSTVLAGGIVGMGFVGLAYILIRRYEWHDSWLNSTGNKIQPLSLTLALGAVLFFGWTVTSIDWVLLYGTKSLGLKVSEVMLAYAALGAASAIISLSSFFAGLLADLLDWLTLRIFHRPFGRLLVFAIGVLILCCGFVFLLITSEAKGLSTGLIVAWLGVAILTPSLFTLVIVRAPYHLWGTMVGAYLAVSAIGNLGSTVNGLSADKFGLASPFILGIVTSVVALLLIIMAARFGKKEVKLPTESLTQDIETEASL